MLERLAPGTTHEMEITVGADRTAHTMGNVGVSVLATPWMIALLENACNALLRPHLPEGGGSVGTMVDVRHLGATPVGLKVRARATVLEVEGRRVLFQVEASDEVEKIAEGRHERFAVVDMARFLARAQAKAARR
jgi:predicted thioesterase